MIEFVLIGVFAGFAAGYLGIGGGLLIVPALTWLFLRDPATAGMATHFAVATSMATMLVTSLSSVIAHHRRNAVRWETVRLLMPGLMLGAAAGAWLADRLSTQHLGAAFGIFAFLAGLQLLLIKSPGREVVLPGKAISTIMALCIGGISSLVGIGGGSMTAPWLMWHGIRAQRAVATAAACGYPIAVAGTLCYVILGQQQGDAAVFGYVHPAAFSGIALASLVTAPLGAAATHKSPPHWVRRAFGILLLLVAWQMLRQAA